MILRFLALATLLLTTLAAGAAEPEQLGVRFGRHEGYTRVVFEWARPAEYRIERSGDTITVAFARAARLDVEKLSRQLPPAVTSLRAEQAADGLRITLGAAPGATFRDSRAGGKVILDIAPQPARVESPNPGPDTAPIRLAPQAAGPAAAPDPSAAPPRASAAVAPVPLQPAPAPAKQAAAPRPLVTVDAWRAGDRIVLRFNWRTEVGAAAFVRNGALWIAFDAPARIDLGGIQVVGRGALGAARQLPVESATVLQAAIEGQWNGEVKRDGSAWIFELAPGSASGAGDSADLRVRSTANGLEAVMTVGAAGRPLRLLDPEGNDLVEVLPLRTVAGTVAHRALIDFDLLSTMQGIVMRPKVEKLSLRIAGSELTIAREGGLRMSLPGAVAAHRSAPAGVTPRLLDLAAWAADGEPFNAHRVKMQHAIVKAKDADKHAGRLALARFFLARGRAADALGVIGEIARLRPDLESSPEILALRGAAHLLQGGYAEALADFSHPKLANLPELEPWRGMLAAARGAWLDAFNRFDESDSLIAHYPAWLAGRIGLLAAEAALVINDVDAARARLGAPAIKALKGPDRHYAEVLRGHLLKKVGDTERAKQVWRSVIRDGDRLSRAKAQFAETDTLYVQGAIDVQAAIERLERLAFGWRGDVFEFDLLNRLATLKATAQDYRGALASLRSAVTYFESVHGAQASAADMNDQFRALFLGNAADSMSPVVALGLFDEFRELIPAGKDGDVMIRKLAERLARVDLLDDAAGLLERQMSTRLTGTAKAEVGARLAAIRLAANRPEEALGAILGSAEPNLPEDLARQRGLLRARAEAKLGRTDLALQIAAADDSREADALRLEIFWRKSMWREAAALLARWMDKTDPADAAKLDEAKARIVLNWAVALALGKDTAGIEMLRERFAARFGGGPYGRLFNAIVGNDGAPPEDYHALAKQVADLDTLDGFVSGYRETSGKPALSALK